VKILPFFAGLAFGCCLPAALAEDPLLPPPELGPIQAAPRPSPPPGQLEKLAAAIKIGREWQNRLKAGEVTEGMKLWGYAAFEGTTAESLEKGITSQGKLKATALMEDRCLVDLSGNAAGGRTPGSDTYVTLRWFSEYDQGYRRESLILHEPAKGGNGLKITGLRREMLPKGKQGAFELAADLGQLALLKLHGAPRERWEAYEKEAGALAEALKITLPKIPDTVGDDDKPTGEKLVNLIMLDSVPAFDKLGEAGGAAEAKAILNAFAMFMMYVPGEETSARLAVLAGAEAEKAKLPPHLWKPLIEAVVKKSPVPEVHESIQNMIAGVSAHLGLQQANAELKAGTKETLDMAFENMRKLPTYQVRAELTATDGRKSTMDGALAPGAMDLKLVGFDGQQQRRVVTEKGFFLTTDGGKTWVEETEQETAMGLCRTLQRPVDPTDSITERFTFTLAGKEMLASEELFRFTGTSSTGAETRTYWVLVSKAGPVIRRACLPMTFGSTSVDALLIYTKLGKPVEIGDKPPAEK
jgi:hypothetical protein